MTFFNEAPMAAGIQQSNAKITADLKQAIQDLVHASEKTIQGEYSAEAYRQCLVSAMTHLKDTTIKVLQAGSMAGLNIISTIYERINDICLEDRGSEENKIFWDELANHYPPRQPNHWLAKNLPGPLQIKLAAGVLDQMTEPKRIPRQMLEMMPNAHFMDALTMAIQRLMPPYRRFDISMQHCLSLLTDHLYSIEGFKVIAVDYLLAHQDFYIPLIRKLMSIAEPQPIIAARDADSMGDRKERYERQLLGKLGYSPDEIDELYVIQQQRTLMNIDYLTQTGKSLKEINEARANKALLPGMPTTAELQQLTKSLSWPADVLVMLHEESQNPLFKDLANVAFEYPDGNRPYLHFEKLGITRTPQWHQSFQEKSSPLKTAMLYEHAIHTDGINLALGALLDKEFEINGAPLSRMLFAISSAPLNHAESYRKAQSLFDALIARANNLVKPEAWIIDRMKASAISPKYYRQHKQLSGDLLEDRLGL